MRPTPEQRAAVAAEIMNERNRRVDIMVGYTAYGLSHSPECSVECMMVAVAYLESSIGNYLRDGEDAMDPVYKETLDLFREHHAALCARIATLRKAPKV